MITGALQITNLNQLVLYKTPLILTVWFKTTNIIIKPRSVLHLIL